MSKPHTRFVCNHCGTVHSKWMGKCPDCGEWNSLNEQTVATTAEDRHRPVIADADTPLVVPITDILPDAGMRYPSGIGEFDRVLGGGIVPGSAILIGGDPGIGKSTLLLQAGHALARLGRRTLYISSEESLAQLRLRADRLSIACDGEREGDAPAASRRAQRIARTQASDPGRDGLKQDGRESKGPVPLLVASQANLDVISNILQTQKPDVVVVDSIQMVYRPDAAAAPGSATQLRDAAARLIWLAKQLGFSLVLVGHVTKEGAIAGPKILEHLVDCVIYFEGDRFHAHRLIRSVKNRFGSTDEIGIFEMTGEGLLPVEDPSKLFLQTQRAARPGSVVLAACEGTRTLLVEVQALCAQSVFGSAKRKATGVDSSRVAMVLAVLEKHADIVLGDQDVFVNIVGGVRVTEPAADLAIALAVFGAMTNRSLPESTAICGELGLGGELRPVHHQRQRLAEAARIGFRRFILPAAQAPSRRSAGASAAGDPSTLEVVSCEGLSHAIRHLA